jgi:hypothetical protein
MTDNIQCGSAGSWITHMALIHGAPMWAIAVLSVFAPPSLMPASGQNVHRHDARPRSRRGNPSQ